MRRMKNADNVVRVGGVGAGRIFQWAHLPAYPPLSEKARLVGIYDLDAERARQAMDALLAALKEYAEKNPRAAGAVEENIAELTVHKSLDSLLEKVDVIDICTHARGRIPSAIAACKAGVSAMAEKPMCRTWTEAIRAEKVFDEAEGVIFQLNDDAVFDHRSRYIRALIQQGEIGQPIQMMISFGSSLDHATVLKAQANGIENGGGCLLDYGSHGLAAAWSILGRRYVPRRVEAIDIGVRYRHRVLENEPFVMEVDDNAQIQVLFENLETGSWCTLFMETTWCGPHIGFGEHRRESIQVTGSKGVIETSWLTDKITLRSYDGGITEIPLLKEAGERFFIAAGIRAFVDCMRLGRPPELDIHFGAGIAAVCSAAYLSAIRKKAIAFDELDAYAQRFVDEYGDCEEADDAMVTALLAPYALDSDISDRRRQ